MMMYEDSGLEPEADYDDGYTVATSSSVNPIPAYYPKPQTNSFTDNRHMETEMHKYAQVLEPAEMADRNQNSHVYQQFEPKIQQVFEEYDPQAVNGHQYVPQHHSQFSEKFGQERDLSRHQKQTAIHPTTQAVASTSSSSISSSSSCDKSSAIPVTVPTKMASAVAPSVIPTLQLPTTRIPKKKKPEVQQLTVPMDNGSALRIDTEEGWRQMNALLENSDMDSNSERLVDLLSRCLQAEINMNLLTSNNTPKIVKKLSKNHENPEVKKIAAQCVTKWKKEVTATPKEKKSKRNTEADSPSNGSVKKTEKRRLSEEADKSEKRKGKGASISKEDEQTADAKKRKLESAKKPEAAKVAAPKAQQVSLSTGFSDALNSLEQTRNKRQTPRKKVAPKVNDPLSVLDVMNDEKPKQIPAPVEARRKSPTPPVDDIPVKANRKIKFADECGKEMVEIKYFEIEEGERINVNRLSPEEMKHHEAMMERRFKQESVAVEEEDEKEIPWHLIPLDESMLSAVVRGCNSEAKVIEERRQMSSLRAFCDPTEVFYITEDPEDYDPHAVLPDPPIIPVYTEKELLLQKLQAQAATVAPTPAPVVTQKPEEKALPDNLKNLLDGLKKQGIVGGGPGPSTPSLSNLIPGLSTILGQTNSQPAAAPTYTQAPIVQPQYQQIPQQQFQFPPPQYQQQFAPQVTLQPNLPGLPGGRLPQRPVNTGRPPLLCHQFKNGNCRFGDRCKFSHDLNATYIPRNRNDGFRGHGRPYDRNDRRDFRDRRDYRDSRDFRDRERDQPNRTPTDNTFSPNAQSPRTILSPSDQSNAGEPKITTIPADRTD